MVSLGTKTMRSLRKTKIGAKDVSRGLRVGSKIAGIGATAATMAGQPELAVPLAGASLLMNEGADVASELEK